MIGRQRDRGRGLFREGFVCVREREREEKKADRHDLWRREKYAEIQRVICVREDKERGFPKNCHVAKQKRFVFIYIYIYIYMSQINYFLCPIGTPSS